MTTAEVPTPRTVNGCDTCAIQDDHPRHHSYALIQIPEGLPAGKIGGTPILNADGNRTGVHDITSVKHIDCCAADGCEICITHLEFAGAKRGPELIAHFESLPDEHAQALLDRHGIETPSYQKEATA